MDFTHPLVLDFDLVDGFCKSGQVTPQPRRLSNMAAQFADSEAAAALLDSDPLLYEFYGLPVPEQPGALSYGTTIIYPGQVGEEYYMTKGHFHTVLDTAEVYYTLSGEGMMVMETPEGETDVKALTPGDALYVPGRWAHRSVNTGSEPLVMFFVYPADAGHDYGTIESKGFRKLVVCRDGRPTIIDNPRWKEEE